MSHRSGEMWVIRSAGEIDGGGTWRYGMSSRNVQRVCMDRKIRFFEGFWVNLFKAKVEEGFVMK